MRLADAPSVELWLERNHWFEHATIESLSPLPDRWQAPHPVRLVVSVVVEGGRYAGEPRTTRRLQVTGLDVSEYRLEGSFGADHCVHGAELQRLATGFELALDVPGEMRLSCAAVEVVETEAREVTPAWLSERHICVEAPAGAPTASSWHRTLMTYGHEAVWRRYGDVGTPPEEVPCDYTGWFLQSVHRIDADPGGILMSCGRSAGLMSIGLELWDAEARSLWEAAGAVLAAIPNSVVYCGNVRQSGNEWLVRRAEVQVGINVQIESSRGEALAAIEDASGWTRYILPHCSEGSSICLRFVDRIGDAVFSQLQVPQLLSELRGRVAALEARHAAARTHGEAIIAMVEQWDGRVHTCVRFIGD